jgi:hypothetical protein
VATKTAAQSDRLLAELGFVWGEMVMRLRRLAVMACVGLVVAWGGEAQTLAPDVAKQVDTVFTSGTERTLPAARWECTGVDRLSISAGTAWRT